MWLLHCSSYGYIYRYSERGFSESISDFLFSWISEAVSHNQIFFSSLEEKKRSCAAPFLWRCFGYVDIQHCDRSQLIIFIAPHGERAVKHKAAERYEWSAKKMKKGERIPSKQIVKTDGKLLQKEKQKKQGQVVWGLRLNTHSQKSWINKSEASKMQHL